MFSWAKNYTELQKICTIFGLNELENPKRIAYKRLEGCIQEGPQCGLVALAIACKLPTQKFVDILFDTAKKQGFTYNGEMFSSVYMEGLARLFLPSNAQIRVVYGPLDCQEIKEHLLNGGLALVPYDSDKNNSPGLFNGHKAHWALVCGGVETEDNFYVIARHGKSRYLAIWKLTELSNSNGQLNEFSPDRNLGDLEYKIPEGGLIGIMGLRESAVLITE